MTHLNTQ